MTRQEFLNNFWRFYLLTEDKFVKSLSYVELCEENYGTYSIEFVSQLREIGSEIDIIMKEICEFGQTERKTITDYAPRIFELYPNIKNQVVNGKALKIKPFENWCSSRPAKSLVWWDAYNSVKHGRIENFSFAKMGNVFNALGALFILNNYLLKKIAEDTDCIDIVDKESSIFTMENWKMRYSLNNSTVLEFVDET